MLFLQCACLLCSAYYHETPGYLTKYARIYSMHRVLNPTMRCTWLHLPFPDGNAVILANEPEIILAAILTLHKIGLKMQSSRLIFKVITGWSYLKEYFTQKWKFSLNFLIRRISMMLMSLFLHWVSFGEILHYFTHSQMDPLKWMGAVRMSPNSSLNSQCIHWRVSKVMQNISKSALIEKTNSTRAWI